MKTTHRKSISRIFAAVAALTLWGGPGGTAQASIKPASLFTDNAVLQQKQADPVWGKADPNEPITVSINGQSVKTTADAEGKWFVRLKPMAAGGPYTLTIAGMPGDTVTVTNVLVGDVWLASGQSNMEFPIVMDDRSAPVIATAHEPEIRLFFVAHGVAVKPEQEQPEPPPGADQLDGKWQVCSPEVLGSEHFGVPDGIAAGGFSAASRTTRLEELMSGK